MIVHEINLSDYQLLHFFIAIVVAQNCSDNPVRKFSESVKGQFDDQHQNDPTHLKNLATFTATFLKCI